VVPVQVIVMVVEMYIRHSVMAILTVMLAEKLMYKTALINYKGSMLDMVVI
jgi:hypothetical protein